MNTLDDNLRSKHASADWVDRSIFGLSKFHLLPSWCFCIKSVTSPSGNARGHLEGGLLSESLCQLDVGVASDCFRHPSPRVLVPFPALVHFLVHLKDHIAALHVLSHFLDELFIVLLAS